MKRKAESDPDIEPSPPTPTPALRSSAVAFELDSEGSDYEGETIGEEDSYSSPEESPASLGENPTFFENDDDDFKEQDDLISVFTNMTTATKKSTTPSKKANSSKELYWVHEDGSTRVWAHVDPEDNEYCFRVESILLHGVDPRSIEFTLSKDGCEGTLTYNSPRFLFDNDRIVMVEGVSNESAKNTGFKKANTKYLQQFQGVCKGMKTIKLPTKCVVDTKIRNYLLDYYGEGVTENMVSFDLKPADTMTKKLMVSAPRFSQASPPFNHHVHQPVAPPPPNQQHGYFGAQTFNTPPRMNDNMAYNPTPPSNRQRNPHPQFQRQQQQFQRQQQDYQRQQEQQRNQQEQQRHQQEQLQQQLEEERRKLEAEREEATRWVQEERQRIQMAIAQLNQQSNMQQENNLPTQVYFNGEENAAPQIAEATNVIPNDHNVSNFESIRARAHGLLGNFHQNQTDETYHSSQSMSQSQFLYEDDNL